MHVGHRLIQDLGRILHGPNRRIGVGADQAAEAIEEAHRRRQGQVPEGSQLEPPFTSGIAAPPIHPDRVGEWAGPLASKPARSAT